MSEVHIRPATIADLPVLREFEQGVIAAERPYSLNLKPDPIRYYDLEAMLESEQFQLLMIEWDGDLAGCGYGRLDESAAFFSHPQNVYLGFMFVKPEHRGKGLSGKIMEALIEWGKSRGAGEARLDVYSDNASAVRAYEKAGFLNLLTHMRMSI